MKNILYILAGLLILIAEIAVTNKFPIFGATPDLLLVYIVILSRNTDAKSNFIVAAALGFIKDILI
ncbi:MAG: rod shape-determining protein MreD, partial [Proteocatella sp.]|nr:rod shape-determining protein MreD [Proteocatella sp.]